MTQKKQFAMRFAAVALAVGLISPSVSIENTSTSGEDGYSVNVSILNAAQARQNVNRNVNRNVNHNRNVRVNNNVNHHNSGHYDRGYYDNYHHDHTTAKVLGGVAVGAAVVKATESSSDQ